jgi:hypothetical protein
VLKWNLPSAALGSTAQNSGSRYLIPKWYPVEPKRDLVCEVSIPACREFTSK